MTMSRFCSGVQTRRRSPRVITSTGASRTLIRLIVGAFSTSVTRGGSVLPMTDFDHNATPRRNVPPPRRLPLISVSRLFLIRLRNTALRAAAGSVLGAVVSPISCWAATLRITYWLSESLIIVVLSRSGGPAGAAGRGDAGFPAFWFMLSSLIMRSL